MRRGGGGRRGEGGTYNRVLPSMNPDTLGIIAQLIKTSTEMLRKTNKIYLWDGTGLSWQWPVPAVPAVACPGSGLSCYPQGFPGAFAKISLHIHI